MDNSEATLAKGESAASLTTGAKTVDGSGKPAATFAGYPMTKYHPVYGRKDANDPNEAASLFQPPHNWFDTAGEADMHRTDREAQQVIQHNLATKVADKNALLNGEELPSAGTDRPAIVRNSVQAQESVNAGKVEPL